MTFQLNNSLLPLRLKQLFRISYQLGIIRTLLVWALIILSIATTYLLISTGKNSYPVVSFYLLLFLILHVKRKDKNFLKINVLRYRTVYFVEYTLLSIPLIICLLLFNRQLELIALPAGILFLSAVDFNFNIRHKTLNTKLQKFIPTDFYEWKAGVRKNFIILSIVYLLGVCFSWLVAAVPVAMIIIGLIISDFFSANESWQMLLSFEKSADKVLLHKMKRHLLLYAGCNSPLILLFIIFHYNLWYIPCILFIVLSLIHIYAITIKYAYYEPDGNTGINPVLQFIGIIFGFMLITIPLLPLLSVFFFRKACTHIKPILHDFD